MADLILNTEDMYKSKTYKKIMIQANFSFKNKYFLKNILKDGHSIFLCSESKKYAMAKNVATIYSLSVLGNVIHVPFFFENNFVQ